MSTVANRFRTFGLTTSAHGFPQLANTEQLVSRIFWSLVLLFFSGLLLYNTGNVVATYFDEGSRWGTSISERYSSELAHPTVTICNYNKFRRSVVKQLEVPKSLLRYFLAQNTASHYFYAPEWSGIMKAVRKDGRAWRAEHNMSTKALRGITSHQCEDLIKMMRLTLYQTKQYRIQNPCSSAMAFAVQPLDIIHTCTQLRIDRGNHSLKMSTMGQAKGTTLLLDVEPDEYLDMADANPPDVGLMVQLSDGVGIEFGKWINLSPGSHNWVGMRKLEHRAGEAFDSFFKPPCAKTPKMKFMNDSFYSKEMCIFDCTQIPFVQTCNCYFVETTKHRLCEEFETHGCFAKLRNISNQWEDEIAECSKSCEAPCESKTITASSTTSHFPSPAQLPGLQEHVPEIFANMSLQEIKRRYILLDIYYASGYVTVIEWRLRTPLGSMFSNLGGLMGLFLGISIITLIHGFTHFCVEPFKNTRCNKKSRKATTRIEDSKTTKIGRKL